MATDGDRSWHSTLQVEIAFNTADFPASFAMEYSYITSTVCGRTVHDTS